MSINDASIRQLLDFALDTVWESGKATLQYFQTRVEVETKNDQTPVTIADRKTEKLLRSRISEAFPNHAIVGEEYGLEGSQKASFRWIIDPIDGTKSFVRGVPLYGTMLGLEREGRAILGAISFPALNEIVAAAAGEGCFWNGRRAAVSPCNRLDEALLLCTDYTHLNVEDKRHAFHALCAATKLQRTWGDCYGHCLVATGRAELMLDASMKVWDCAALLPILQEAGGTFTDWDGNSTIYGPDALSTNSALFSTIMDIIKNHTND